MSKFFLILKVILEIWPYLVKFVESGKEGYLHLQRRRSDKKIVAIFKENREGSQSIEDTADRASRLNDIFK